MSTIGLIVRPGIPKAVSLGRTLSEWSPAHGHQLILEEESAFILGAPGKGISPEDLAKKSDLLVVLGGDGTLIGVAR